MLLRGIALQVLRLQRLHVVLVDFQRGAELDGQPRQHVVACHQQQRLAVDFLSGGDGKSSHLYSHQEF